MAKKNLQTVLDYKKTFRKTNDLIKHIESLGYTAVSSNSHIKFTKPGYTPLLVPNHKDLSVGVCGQIGKILLAEN